MTRPVPEQNYDEPVIRTLDDLPERMTWDELGQVPEEIAGEVELWDGRVVVVRRGPAEHMEATAVLWSCLREAIRGHGQPADDECFRARIETNVFFKETTNDDYVTPDFLVHRCLPEYAWVRAKDVVVVGEVRSRSNTLGLVESRKARFAGAGIPWYWEVSLSEQPARIASVRVYALESEAGELPGGVRPLRPTNYLLVQEWTPESAELIEFEHPIPIRISWEQLAI